MAEYERVSANIYSVYLKYAAPEDIHVYSIDECFIDCTGYLHLYMDEASMSGLSPAHTMAMKIIRDVLAATGITATVGIGTNLYLSKIAMDIVAKKAKPDKDGVRIAELDEDSYKILLWDHKPLTDFWQIGPGKARRLENKHILLEEIQFFMCLISYRGPFDPDTVIGKVIHDLIKDLITVLHFF